MFPTRALVALLLTFALFPAIAGKQAQVSVAPQTDSMLPVKHIVICVDGVGYSTIEKMRAEGKFQYFRQPARMIAPFPTLTNVAMTEILETAGAKEAAGYEDNFYDADKNRMRGGLLDRFNNQRFIKGTFRELFDYHPSAIKSGLGYALPPLSAYLEALTDLVRLKQKISSSRDTVFFAYLGSTDSLSHLGGERMVRSFLSLLDDDLKDIVREGKGQVQVTIFSDHGNHYRGYKRVSLKSPLRRAGFRVENRLRGERSIVIPQFGLIGCALLFTKEENEARLAQVSAQLRGVDFAVYEKDAVVHVAGRDGLAMIERRADKFRYQTLSGDPLGLRNEVANFRWQGKADADGFVADSDWFAATRDGTRPDVVRRVFQGATEHVRNRANVILSFEDGFYYGSYPLDLLTFLQATHGNAMREQSYGFVMTTGSELPAYLRAGEMWKAVGEPALRKAHTHH
ncbi:MAG: hypothetical protein H7Y30_06930 [Pyrinomonadaceae bacterium]|nr:hypothetical protein [Pyrinomonadaceae bacterium]